MRSVSPSLAVVLSLAMAGALSWMVQRRDAARATKATACSDRLGDVFANRATTADSVLLERLLAHQDACMGDAVYVDQLRRMMLLTEQPARARTLLLAAEREGTFAGDELVAERASVDMAEADIVSASGREGAARERRDRSMASANALRARWPEWSRPYRLLEEGERQTWAVPAGAEPVDYGRMERAARARIMNGAFVRSFSNAQAFAFVFVAATGALLALFAGLKGLLAMREMRWLETSSVATALPGYVELKGTLHVPAGAHGVISPWSHQMGVWYELESRSGAKGARSQRERSAQPFVLRDATGDVAIDPRGMTVRTRHVDGAFGNSGGVSSYTRVTERLLKEADVAYVLGELSVAADPSGIAVRTLRAAPNGRRLLVSNHSEEQLMRMERLWFVAGVLVFALAALVLAWSLYQRYHVSSVPGVLL